MGILHDFKVPTEYISRRQYEANSNAKYRTEFMRDRDRIMYCGSFRRLSGKTQIYLAGKNDNQRNRLTHTLEVAQIARTVALALGLDCDLTEAIALGHDMGHTPFGHAGEQMLHEIMVPGSTVNIKTSPMNDPSLLSSDQRDIKQFGFKHNIQSLRVAATIEQGYGKNGLNLTNYTLWGILHHSSLVYGFGKVNTEVLDANYIDMYKPYYKIPNFPNVESWSFEAFVVEQADEVAQWHHDLEDAIRGYAMDPNEICKTLNKTLGEIMNDEDKKRLNSLKKKKILDREYVTSLSRIVVNTLVNRLILCSTYNLELLWNKYNTKFQNKNQYFTELSWQEDEVRKAVSLRRLDEDDSKISRMEKSYKNTIHEKIHHSRNVERMNAKGQYIIRKLMEAYYTHPQQLPDAIIARYMVETEKYSNFQKTLQVGFGSVRTKFEQIYTNKATFDLKSRIALMRSICDHIAGMTDHYAIEEFQNLYE